VADYRKSLVEFERVQTAGGGGITLQSALLNRATNATATSTTGGNQ
jgi:hypothetical protein